MVVSWLSLCANSSMPPLIQSKETLDESYYDQNAHRSIDAASVPTAARWLRSPKWGRRSQQARSCGHDRQYNQPDQRQYSVQLYNQILPSVVDIQVTATTEQADTGLFPFLGGQQQPRQVRGEGTGWVYDDQGHIVTNNHVVENATEITVNFSDGSWATGIGVHDQ